MLARFRTLWEGISTSLWFVPGIMGAGAMLVAAMALTVRVDMTPEGLAPEGLAPGGSAPGGSGPEQGMVWWLHAGSGDDASDLLSSLLTSMVTMATLVISITMVVLTLAAGQLGPRLIRSFMGDKRSQFVLGFFFATIVYLVLVLRMVKDGVPDEEVPHLAVTLGTALMLISVFLLLYFVHHLARSIVADTVIQRVGRDLDLAIADMLPGTDPAAVGPAGVPPPPAEDSAVLRLPEGGYVEAINYEGLVRCAARAGAVVALDFRPGRHLLPGGAHGRVFPASAWQDDLQRSVARCVIIGDQRTANQDLEFAVRQLVEVALRALSPSLNDPFTAIAVIDRLGVSLALAMGRGHAPEAWRDQAGTIRVTGTSTTFNGLVDGAFNQIRQAAGGRPAVLMRIIATLAELAEHARNDEHRRVLALHVGLVEAEARRSITEPYDLAAVGERSAAARARLPAA